MSFVLLLELSHFAKLFHFREYAANIEDAIFLSNRLLISRLDSVNSIIAFLSFLFSDLLDNLHDEGRLVGLLPELVLLHLDHHPGVDQKGLFGTHGIHQINCCKLFFPLASRTRYNSTPPEARQV